MCEGCVVAMVAGVVLGGMVLFVCMVRLYIVCASCDIVLVRIHMLILHCMWLGWFELVCH